MSAVEVEAPRPRPLSGGLWTLFSWLRRDEHSSSDSLSSVGSDRTAASFAFLGPGHYATNTNPLVIPAPGPPTDSYKKRVRDRNLRRQHDRDITLLRKYGLHGFDAFSLPNARRVAAAASDRSERDRRATSELLQRRAHVPGKRRAPLPPSAPTSLGRTRARKRPAPQPPLPLTSIPKIPEEDKDIEILLNNSNTLPMNSQRVTDKQPIKHNEVTMGCKYEKYSKKEKHQETATKEVKPRQDKSFLKQIFDNRKRNSAIETSSVKLLPSISELDKQAHEIIEKYKLKELEQTGQHGPLDKESPSSSTQVEAWICTRCLKKYNATVITCLYCLPLENALLNNSTKSSKVSNHATQTTNSQRSGLEDKEKLKEILKEMKNSLPKNPTASPFKSKNNSSNEIESKRDPNKAVEAATLRIGSFIPTESKKIPAAALSSPIRKPDDRETGSSEPTNDTLATIDNVLVTQPEVLVHTKDNIVIVDKPTKKVELDGTKPPNIVVARKVDNVTKTEIASKILNAERSSKSSGISRLDINTPLKVSSLFNPIYMPKNASTRVPVVPSTIELKEIKNTQKDEAKPVSATNTTNYVALPNTLEPKQVSSVISLDTTKLEPMKEKELKQQFPNEKIAIVKKILETQTSGTNISESSIPLMSQSIGQEVNCMNKLDQHSRRRNLINQLEQSIAKGDERAAADAAVKLAQLRLSCSVLSFSSQIVAEASTSSTNSSDKAVKTDYKTEAPKSSQPTQTGIVPLVAPLKSLESIDKNNIDKTNKNHLSGNDSAIIEQDKIKTHVDAVPEAVNSNRESELNEIKRQKKDAALQILPRCTPSTSRATEKKYTNEDVP